MRVLDIMTPNVHVATQDEPIIRVAEIMRDLNVGIVPIVSDRETMRVIGVITDRDIVKREVAAGLEHESKAREIMSHEVLHRVGPDDDAEIVVEIMNREGIRRVLVVAPNGRLLGIVSQADLFSLTEGKAKPDRLDFPASALSG